MSKMHNKLFGGVEEFAYLCRVKQQNRQSMLMKKNITLLVCLLATTVAWAVEVHRPMLEQGKTWHYTYHHFEAKSQEELTGEEKELRDFYHCSSWEVDYTLHGDTIINGQKYMKMYRGEFNEYGQKKNEAYYSAYREEDGKVYVLYKNEGAKEFLLIDFSLRLEGCDEGFKDAVAIEDSINVLCQTQTFPELVQIEWYTTESDIGLANIELIEMEAVGLEELATFIQCKW